MSDTPVPPVQSGYLPLAEYPDHIYHLKWKLQDGRKVLVEYNDELAQNEERLRSDAYGDPDNKNDGERKAAFRLALAADPEVVRLQGLVKASRDLCGQLERAIGKAFGEFEVSKLVYAVENGPTCCAVGVAS